MTGEMTIRTKPKYTRASAPKVRTGCLTCKIRHVKCDEAKPTCKKCQNSKVSCDGYLAMEHNEAPQKKSRKTRALLKNQPLPVSPLLHSWLDPDTLQDHVGSAFFHHFRTITVPDLAMSPHSTSFWDRHVLPLSNAIPAVRYAATALGVAHRSFLLDCSDPSAYGAKKSLENIAIQHYNNAIDHLLPHATSCGVRDVRTILTCSLLFYCLENVRGCSSESIQHLRSGSKLILSCLPRPLAETGKADASVDDFIGEIASLFARLGVQASLYQEDEVVPDLRDYIKPVPRDPDNLSQPFRDFTVAQDSLDDLDIDLSTYTNRAFVLAKKSRNVLLPEYTSEPPIYIPSLDPEAVAATNGPSYADGVDVGLVVGRFKIWRRRFDKTVQRSERRGATKREVQEIAMLELRRRVWETMLEEVPSGSPEQAESILNQAELVLRSFSSKHPIFTLASHISPSVSFICFYSNDDRQKRRALDILRSVNMREAVWDSSSLASIIKPQLAG